MSENLILTKKKKQQQKNLKKQIKKKPTQTTNLTVRVLPMDLSAPWPVRTISIKKLKPKRILILLFMQSVDTARGCMDNLCSVYLLLRVFVDFKGFQNQMFHDDILLPNCESYIVI